jgi:outer membrane lipoprotein-sorting protein
MPAVVVPAVIAAAAAVGSLPASAVDPLPGKSPEQVLALAAGHTTHSLSGTVEQTSDLGLPELPETGPSPAASELSWLELLSSPHTARVYTDGPTKARVQVLDRMAERDLVWNGQELWLYNSRNNTVAHATVPAEWSSMDKPMDNPRPDRPMPTPDEIAGKILATLDPSTDLAVRPDVQVAGRAAYNLILSPRSQQTLVGSVAIAVDGETGLPLSVEVHARGQAEPAFSVAYTSLTLGSPDPALFEFTPPPGATVEELQPAPPSAAHKHTPPQPTSPDATPPDVTSPDAGSPEAVPPDVTSPESVPPAPGRPAVTGSGWETIVEIPASAGASQVDAVLAEPLLEQAVVRIDGGRLLSTSLINVLFTDDGRIFAGAVPVEMLQAAATAR